MHNNNFFIKPNYTSWPSASYFEDNLPSTNIWQPDIYLIAADLAREFGNKTIIDLGCGRADKLVALHPEFSIIGVDFGPNIEFCNSTYAFGKWINADFENILSLPIEDGELQNSLIICSDVIEHLMDPSNLINSIKTLMGSALIAVLSTPERDLTRGYHDQGPPPNRCHIREWNLDELETLLNSFDLNISLIDLTLSSSIERQLHTAIVVLAKNDLPDDAIEQIKKSSKRNLDKRTQARLNASW